ncbi:MAG: hypothetical protein MSG64_15735 [Pyrinomonadaceae bacterium MAG19_C2-C3]|nr:hypothetical protein [Pyrinomonadaceae bacterium MAG19_C2-C3]
MPNSTKFDLNKQITFAVAATLTQLAKESQSAVVDDLESTFTIRNEWLQPSNRFGIHITPATKDNLESSVGTDADWLRRHLTGEDKTAEGGNIAIPTQNARRSQSEIIPRGRRPKGLRGQRDVVLQTRNGAVLYQRQGTGKTSKLLPMYLLRPRARTEQRNVLFDSTARVVRTRIAPVFGDKLQLALSTAK